MNKKTGQPRAISGQQPFLETKMGAAFLGDSSELLAAIPDESVDLIMTSPPYALHFKKEYGNVDQDRYVNWLLSFAPDVRRILKPSGSFVLNIGGSWTPGKPTRSLCHLEVAVRMVREQSFHLAQEFYWYNPAKLPAPAEWVNVRKIRVKDSVECIWWFSREPFPKAHSREVLQPYSPDMLRLLRRGYRLRALHKAIPAIAAEPKAVKARRSKLLDRPDLVSEEDDGDADEDERGRHHPIGRNVRRQFAFCIRHCTFDF